MCISSAGAAEPREPWRAARRSSTGPCRPPRRSPAGRRRRRRRSGASSLTSRPAWIRPVRSLVTETTSADLAVVLGRDDDDAAAEPIAQRVGQCRAAPAFSRPATRRAISLTPATSAASSRRRCAAAAAAAERQLHLQLLDLARQPLARPPAAAARPRPPAPAVVFERRRARVRARARCCCAHATAPVAGERLDAPHAGRDAALLGDDERADVAGRAHVRAAAQLDAEARDRHDAHAVAVLLAEQRHRAGGDRLFGRAHVGLRPACCGRSAR